MRGSPNIASIDLIIIATLELFIIYYFILLHDYLARVRQKLGYLVEMKQVPVRDAIIGCKCAHPNFMRALFAKRGPGEAGSRA